MNIRQALAVLAIVAGATGCARIEEAAMPAVAKINAAHPVTPEVRVAQERLLAILADDPKAIEAVKAEADVRMNLRALTCSKGLTSAVSTRSQR